MPLPHDAQVLVIDGRKLLFFRNHGDDARIDLRTESHETRDDAPDREIKSDLAGQSPAPAGTGLGGGTMGETDYHQQDEDAFAAHAADILKRKTLDGDTHPLAIIAAPKTLGVLRAKLHQEVERRIVLELAQAMTNRPVADIEALLQGEAASPA